MHRAIHRIVLNKSIYWAMCEWFDITCGQLMDYVENKGITDNTLFVYVTDTGWIQDPDRVSALKNETES